MSSLAVSRVQEFDETAVLDVIKGAPVTFVTGKGGVGKTTVASLLSKAAASHGERILFVSLYNDSNTASLMGMSKDAAVGTVIPSAHDNIDVLIVTPTSALTSYFSNKKLGAITSKLNKADLLSAVANLVPGLRELLVVSEIRSKADSGRWDRIIVDTPSTGHASALFDVGRVVHGTARSGVIRSQADSAQNFLNNADKVQVVVVTLDHIMPLSEAREFIFSLEDELNMKIAGVVINRSRVMEKQFSSGIDKALSDIFLPLYAVAPYNASAAPKKSIFGRSKYKLPEELSGKVTIKKETSVCIVLGTGGVGKTTMSAGIALSAACSGRKVALITIDPARRLGTALGLDDTKSRVSYLDAKHMKPTTDKKSSLDVFQLDSESEFLDLLERTLSKKDFRHAKKNTFVTAVSGAGIINEFMAIEAMHRLVTSEKYDIVVVDTPPSHHVFDLLDAPSMLQRVFHSPIFKALVSAGTLTKWSANLALGTVLRPVKMLVGDELIEDGIDFLQTIRDVEEVFSVHSQEIATLLKSSRTEYLGICNPTNVSREQVLQVATEMADKDYPVSTIIVNSCEPDEEDIVKELVPFAREASAIGARVALMPEFDKEDPLDIVTCVSKNIKN